MGTIADKLAYLQGTKEDIAAAITAKGGTVTTADTFRSYGDKIRAIEGGSEFPEPINDGKTRLFIELNNPKRLTVGLAFDQSATRGVRLDWGDDSEVISLSGSRQSSSPPRQKHVYPTVGKYTITLTPIGETVLFLGRSGYSNRSLLDGAAPEQLGCLVHAQVGTAVVEPYSFVGCWRIKSIALSDGTSGVSGAWTSNCYNLSCLHFGSGVATTGRFSYAYSLTDIVIPENIATVDGSAFTFCQSLSTVTLLSAMPPTLESSAAFSATPADCAFYVPAGSLETYQTATNWATYASRMQEMEP